MSAAEITQPTAREIWLAERAQRIEAERLRVEADLLTRKQRIDAQILAENPRWLPTPETSRKCPICRYGFIDDGQKFCQVCIPIVHSPNYVIAVARTTQRAQTIAAVGEVKNP